MRNQLCSAAILLFGVALGQATEPQTVEFRSRMEFAKAMNKVHHGLTESEVLELLGKPDDMQTEFDAGRSFEMDFTKVIWRYGTSGHLTPATLGQVYFTTKGRVQWFVGEGEPEIEFLPPEHKLRELLNAIGQVTYEKMWPYNPRKLIHVVNLLQPLGKRMALAVIREYVRVAHNGISSGQEGVYLVLSVLFDSPIHLRRQTMHSGFTVPDTIKDLTVLSRFPISLEQDIPFLVGELGSGTIAGLPESPWDYFEPFEKNGKIRSKPLVPTDKPVEALATLEKSSRWPYRVHAEDNYTEINGRHSVNDQILRLLNSVYPREPEISNQLLPSDDKLDAEIRRIHDGISKLKIRWDSRQDKYTFLDGTSYPDAEPKNYYRQVWCPEFPDAKMLFMFERINHRGLGFGLRITGKNMQPIGPAVIKVVQIGSPEKLIVRYDTEKMKALRLDDSQQLYSKWQTIELLEGTRVRVDLIVNGKSQSSPIYEP
jgi:hypothetical protein